MNVTTEVHSPLSRNRSSASDQSKLSREEVLELCLQCRNGKNQQARRYLLRTHARYAVRIALKYSHHGVPFAALIVEGKAGIVHALNNFDLECRYGFLTYVAYWIRAYILDRVIHSLRSAERGSRSSQSALLKLRREYARFVSLLGEGVSRPEDVGACSACVCEFRTAEVNCQV